jgi:hypothetical protein
VIGARRQIDLRPRNVEKTERVPCRLRPRLVSVDHVVGHRRDPRRGRGSWANRTKGRENCHIPIVPGVRGRAASTRAQVRQRIDLGAAAQLTQSRLQCDRRGGIA